MNRLRITLSNGSVLYSLHYGRGNFFASPGSRTRRCSRCGASPAPA